jgi:glutathione S-transferase
MKPYTVYGWKLSYYTGKINCYLNYKKIPHVFKPMNVIDLAYTAPKKVGARVMPVIKTPDGVWMQDTHDMIEYFENKYPHPSVIPSDPVHRFLSVLLEAWGDEFWVPMVMYYRWNFPESVHFFRQEASSQLLPFPYVPSFVKDKITDGPVKVLKGFLPAVGVRAEQYDVIEKWTNDILQKLDKHFEKNPYLLGKTPTIGDFGLAGPLVPHLCRDPYPRDHLMPNYPNVVSWAKRIENDGYSVGIPLLDKDGESSTSLPSTLTPILQSMFDEFIPMINVTIPPVVKLKNLPKFTTEGKSLPRALEDISVPVLNNTAIFKKRAIPFNLWKFQKVLNEYNKDKETINKYLENNHQLKNVNLLKEFQLPQLQRKALGVKFV